MASALGKAPSFFLIGAILSSIALFSCHTTAALDGGRFLWILDASINVSMEPFRALVADKLPESQRSYGFVLRALIIGIGTWIASNLPWFVTLLGVSNEAEQASCRKVCSCLLPSARRSSWPAFWSPYSPRLKTPLKCWGQERRRGQGFWFDRDCGLHQRHAFCHGQTGRGQFFSWLPSLPCGPLPRQR